MYGWAGREHNVYTACELCVPHFRVIHINNIRCAGNGTILIIFVGPKFDYVRPSNCLMNSLHIGSVSSFHL